MWFAPLLLIAVILGTMPASAQDGLREEFKAGELDLKSWCACQINLDKAPIRFTKDPDEAGDGIVTITADVNSLGGNRPSPTMPSRLDPAWSKEPCRPLRQQS